MSSTVTIPDQRSYIMIETLRGKNPTEIHDASSEVCGDFKADSSTISHWANHFRGDCANIDSDPRPGRPRSSTDERSVKLVAYTLEEDRHVTCDEHSRATGSKNSAGECTTTDLSCL